MKLILTAAVDNLGVPGDIVEVKAGYGRNYLLPRGYAIVATDGAEKQVENLRRARQERAIRDAEHAREVKAQLEALENVEIAVRTSNSGKLFGSVSGKDVIAAIEAAGGPKLEAGTITVKKGEVKTVGSHTTAVQLHEDIQATVKFNVVSQ